MPELPIRASMLDTCRFFSGGGMTLVIDAPASYEPERRYILDVVLTGWLGLDYELRLQDRTDVRLTVRGDAPSRSVVLPEGLFATQTGEWLTPASLPRLPLS